MRKLQIFLIASAAVLLLLLSLDVHAQDMSPDADGPHEILSQPKATYTDRARAKGIEGAVRLRITLLASGQVGDVSVIKTKGWQKMEKWGLTQRAIEAARQIRFRPKCVNGVPVAVVVTCEYTFEVY
jgi:TonB family protein